MTFREFKCACPTHRRFTPRFQDEVDPNCPACFGTGNKHHNYWHQVWDRAWLNMPVRYRDWQETYWVETDQHPPVPEFIKAQAKGKMKILDGVVHALNTELHSYFYGQQQLLGRLLGYMTKRKRDGKIGVNHNRVFHNWRNGSQPRDPKRRELLLQLAGPDGHALAMKMVTEMGIAHWYEGDKLYDRSPYEPPKRCGPNISNS